MRVLAVPKSMAKSVEKYRRNAPNITILSGFTSKDRIITE
jgi:hypothetical protein